MALPQPQHGWQRPKTLNLNFKVVGVWNFYGCLRVAVFCVQCLLLLFTKQDVTSATAALFGGDGDKDMAGKGTMF